LTVVHGAPGTGKTFLAQKLPLLLHLGNHCHSYAHCMKDSTRGSATTSATTRVLLLAADCGRAERIRHDLEKAGFLEGGLEFS
ncbi:unnamed protein product, partial [Amoebophrya sp. A25]